MDEQEPNKFRRITLICEIDHGHEWEPVLLRYAHSVTYLTPDNYAGWDLLELPTACIVPDGRMYDLTVCGMALAKNGSYWPVAPALDLYDPARTSDWDISMTQHGPGQTVMKPYDPETWEQDLTSFIVEVAGYDPDNPNLGQVGLGRHYSRSAFELHRLATELAMGEMDYEAESLRLGDLASLADLRPRQLLLSILRKEVGPLVREPSEEDWREIEEFVNSLVTASVAKDDGLFQQVLKQLDRNLLIPMVGATIAVIGNMAGMLGVVWECSQQEAWQAATRSMAMLKLEEAEEKARTAKWRLQGYDTFEETFYPLEGEYENEQDAIRAAQERLAQLEESQPTESSGGQDDFGVQDQVFIMKPDGTKYPFSG